MCCTDVLSVPAVFVEVLQARDIWSDYWNESKYNFTLQRAFMIGSEERCTSTS
jgi:hypothetical protein